MKHMTDRLEGQLTARAVATDEDIRRGNTTFNDCLERGDGLTKLCGVSGMGYKRYKERKYESKSVIASVNFVSGRLFLSCPIQSEIIRTGCLPDTNIIDALRLLLTVFKEGNLDINVTSSLYLLSEKVDKVDMCRNER